MGYSVHCCITLLYRYCDQFPIALIVNMVSGVIAMAVAAIVNSLWDLRGKIEKKPVWKILVDMTPQQIVNLIDFT